MDNNTLPHVKCLRRDNSAREKALHELQNLIWPRIAKYPSQLSGVSNGASPARTMVVTDPELHYFDEPTFALYPLMTREVGMLITNFTTMVSLYYASL